MNMTMDNSDGPRNDRANKRVDTAHDVACDVGRSTVPLDIYPDVSRFQRQIPQRHFDAGNETWTKLRPLKRKSQDVEDLSRGTPTTKFIPFGPGHERPFVLQYPRRPDSAPLTTKSAHNVYSAPRVAETNTNVLHHTYLPQISQDETLVPYLLPQNVNHANSAAVPAQVTQSMNAKDGAHAYSHMTTQRATRSRVPVHTSNPLVLHNGNLVQYGGPNPALHNQDRPLQRGGINQQYLNGPNIAQAASFPQALITSMPLRSQQDVGNRSFESASRPRTTAPYLEFSHQDFIRRIVRNNVRGHQHNAHPCNPFHKDLNPYDLDLNNVNAALPIPPDGWIYGRKWDELIPEQSWEPGMLGKYPPPGIFDADHGIPDSTQLAYWSLLISIDRSRSGSLNFSANRAIHSNMTPSTDAQGPYQLPQQDRNRMPRNVPIVRDCNQIVSRNTPYHQARIIPALVTSLGPVDIAQTGGLNPPSSSCMRAPASKHVGGNHTTSDQPNALVPAEMTSIFDSEPIAARTRSKQCGTGHFDSLVEIEIHFVLYLIIHGISLEAIGQALSYYRFHNKSAADKAMLAARDKLEELRETETLSVAQARTLTKIIADTAIEKSWAFYLGRASTWDADENGVNAYRGRAWQEAKQRQSLGKFRRQRGRDPREDEPGFAALQIEHEAVTEAEDRGYKVNDSAGLSEYLLGGLAEYLRIEEKDVETETETETETEISRK